jgi:CDP-diacylglycerol--inositol 3-phosphatidyltransferase
MTNKGDGETRSADLADLNRFESDRQPHPEPDELDESDSIFLFIPNIIGYFRIIFLVISLFYMPTQYVQASLFYGISALLDAFDGYAARHFKQSTRFGGILDQLTDRVGTLSLLMVLCTLYPKYMLFFQLSAMLDIASHWMYVWVTCLQGHISHKFIDPASNPILNVYYTSRPVLFFMCAMNELFFCVLYMRHFTSGPVCKCWLFEQVDLKLIVFVFLVFSVQRSR